MVDLYSNNLLAGAYGLWMPVAVCCIIVFNNVNAIVCNIFKLKALPLIGRFSMHIYVTHFLILCTIEFVITYFGLVSIRQYAIWLILGAYMLLLPLCCKYIRFQSQYPIRQLST